MNTTYPKELIALAKESNWVKIKEFIGQFILSTLKDNPPYEVILLKDNKKNNEKDSVRNLTIQNEGDIKKIKSLNGFNTLSIYQSNEFISNNVYLTKNKETIILMAKYMSSINIGTFDCFDFLMMIDSSENTPTFMNTKGDTLESNDMIELFRNYNFNRKIKNIKEIEDKNLEMFIFEQISGKNALWGGEETKAYKEWKEKVADLYREETSKYSYYGGKLTKNYKKFLINMFKIWTRITQNGQYELKKGEIGRFISFINLV